MRHLIALMMISLSSLLCMAPESVAQAWNYQDFSSPSGLSLNGGAMANGGSLQLTPAVQGVAGSVWRNQRESVASGFETTFSFRITNSLGSADGFAFVIQNDPAGTAALGSAFHGLGYGPANQLTAALSASLAIEVDTYANNHAGLPDLGPSEISIHTGGFGMNSPDESFSVGRVLAPYSLADGQVHSLRVVYAPRRDYEFTHRPELSVYLDGAGTPILSIDYGIENSASGGGTYIQGGQAWPLPLVLGGAYVGFTGATGGQISTHEILSWSWNQNRTWYVQAAASATGNGTQSDPYGTIAQAVQAAISGDTIRVLPGTYAEDIEPLGKSLQFEGTGSPALTQVTGRLSAAGNETLRIEKLSITNVDFGTPFATVNFEFHECNLGNVDLTTIFSGSFNQCLMSRVWQWESTTTMDRCVVLENFDCVYGGNGGVDARNSLFRGRTLSVASDSYASLTNCTVAPSVAPGLTLEGSVSLTRCIVWGNVPFQAPVGNVTINDSDIQGGWTGPGSGNISADPMFVNVAGNNWHLAAGSPCIDSTSALTAASGELDFDGDPRRIGSSIDMGADEATGSFDLVGSTLGNGVGDLALGVSNIPAGATHVLILASHTPAPGGLGSGPLLGLMPDAILWSLFNRPPVPGDLFHFPVSANPFSNGPLYFGPGTMTPYAGLIAEVTAIAYSLPFTGILGQTNFVSLAY